MVVLFGIEADDALLLGGPAAAVDDLAAIGSDVEGDPPDPVTLSEPSYDDAGRLRWASDPLPGRLGSLG